MIDVICEKILEELSKRDSVNSLDLKYDSQTIFSALQRLSSLEMVSYDTKDTHSISLTLEGQDVVEHGSPEFRLARMVSQNGTEISSIIQLKHGLQQAISYGWISRRGKSVYLEKNPEIDPTRENLMNIASITDQTLINMYKRYKLITTKTERYFIIRKGANYSSKMPTNATDLTSDMILNKSFNDYSFKKYNFDTVGFLPLKGNLHPLTKMQMQIAQIFLNMGFSEMKTSKWVESSFWNFDALFQPQNHPSRDAHDTFFVENDYPVDASTDYLESVKKIHESGGFGSKGYQNSWDPAEAKKLVLRTHTTSVSARYLHLIARMFKKNMHPKLPGTENRCKSQSQIHNINNCTTTDCNNSQKKANSDAKRIPGQKDVFDDIKSSVVKSTPHTDHNTITDIENLDNFNLQISKELFLQNAYKFYSIDKVFRNETADATHLAEFHQIEGVIVGHNLTLGQLMGVLSEFYSQLGLSQIKFKPAYNPYTEPSMEIFGYHTGLQKWIEIGNSGIFRPEMLKPMGFSDSVTVFGWGLSLERPTMIKYGINNIRDLVGHKVCFDFIKSSEICLFN